MSEADGTAMGKNQKVRHRRTPSLSFPSPNLEAARTRVSPKRRQPLKQTVLLRPAPPAPPHSKPGRTRLSVGRSSLCLTSSIQALGYPKVMKDRIAPKISNPSRASKPLNPTNGLQVDAGKSWPGDLGLSLLFLPIISLQENVLLPIPKAFTYHPQVRHTV